MDRMVAGLGSYRRRSIKEMLADMRPIAGGAQTTAADVAAQTPELWGTELFMEAQDETFWYKFEGPKASNAPIIRRNELEAAGAGDQINVDLLMQLTGAGQTGDTTSIEGNEEALDYRQMAVTVQEYGHGVKWTKKGRVLINHDMRQDAKEVLKRWLSQFLDTRVWKELDGRGSTTIPNQNQWIVGLGPRTSGDNPDDIQDSAGNGRLSLRDISVLKAYAQKTLKIEPMEYINGQEVFGLALDPYAALNLKVDDTTWAQAQREAMTLGKDNPLFTGALGMWDGVILYTSNRVYSAANAHASPVNTARNIFFGAQALSRAYASYPEWTEQYFDYRRKQGIATDLIVGEKANVFDLSAAEDGSGLRAIGHMIVHSAAVLATT